MLFFHRHLASQSQLPAVIVSLLVILSPFMLCPTQVYAQDKAAVVIEQRPFRGLVRQDMAEVATRLAAELGVYELAARELATITDLQFLNSPGSGNAPPSLDGLARMVFSTAVIARGVEGFPPNLQFVVHLRLERPKDLNSSIRDALSRKDLMELYAMAHESRRLLLSRYDALSTDLLPLNPIVDGGKEQAHYLLSVINEIRGLNLYLELLPEYSHNWAAPEAAKNQLVKAERLAPRNPLVLTALAEVFLQLDRPVAAHEYIERALKISPNFPRAHDVKGAVLLRQRLPALAAGSFGNAIKLAPENAMYYVHRASAYLVQEETELMCEDFRQACSLGDCEGLQWATGINRCTGVQ